MNFPQFVIICCQVTNNSRYNTEHSLLMKTEQYNNIESYNNKKSESFWD